MIEIHFGNEITGAMGLGGGRIDSKLVDVLTGSFYHAGYDCRVDVIRINLKMVSEVTGRSIEYISATFVEKCPEYNKAEYLVKVNFEEEYIKFIHSLMQPDHIKIAIEAALQMGIEEGISRKQKEIISVLGIHNHY